MKKHLLASVLMFFSISNAFAEAPTLFGRLFVVADYVDEKFTSDDDLDTSELRGNGSYDGEANSINTYKSYIGLRGSEAMTENTDVVYQFQFSLSLDNDGDSSLANRSNFLGLSNKDWGTFRLGRYWTPIDLINNVVVTKGYWDNLGRNELSDEQRDIRALNITETIPRVSNVAFWS